MHIVRSYIMIVKCLFRARLEYPGAYLGGIIAQWCVFGISMMMIVIMVWNFGELGGWSPIEILLMNAVMILTYGLASSFTFFVSMRFAEFAINGALDEAYTRPLPPFIYLLAVNFNTGYVSHISISLSVLGFSIFQLGLSWTILQWLWFITLIISGAVITGCMMIICEMPGLRTRSRSPISMLFWQPRAFAQYPITIYPKPFQVLFTTILPFGFVAFYPLQVLLGRHDGLLPHVTRWISPAVAVLFIFITVLCWRFFSSKYESAGT